MKVAILTKDKYLYQKLFLELSEAGGFEVCATGAELTVCDLDTVPSGGDVTLSRRSDVGAELRLPIPLGALTARLRGGDRLVLNAARRSARLAGREEKLTELEFALLSLLCERRGFVERRELIEKLWSTGASDSALNVYVHYLREKLERGRERLILSSRRDGYRINEKYLPIPVADNDKNDKNDKNEGGVTLEA